MFVSQTEARNLFVACRNVPVRVFKSLGSPEVAGCCPRIEDETWQNAEDTWKQLPSSKVASAYVQAYRIADKVIQAKGNNKLLVSGGKHPSHFKFTENGGERIDKRRTSARNN
jgi:hypothetical protein